MKIKVLEALSMLPQTEQVLVKGYIEQLEREIFGMRKTIAHHREKEEHWCGVRKGDKNE